MPPQTLPPLQQPIPPAPVQRGIQLRVVLHVLISIIFWYFADAAIFTPFSPFRFENLLSGLFSVDSYGYSFAAQKIHVALPILLGVITGLLFYLYVRHREHVRAPTTAHPPSWRDNVGRYFTWLFACYFVLATAGLFFWGQHAMSTAFEMEALAVPFVIVFLGFYVLVIPTFIFILVRALLIRNRPYAPVPPISRTERLVVVLGIALSLIVFAIYVGSAAITSSKLPRSIKLSDLSANPANFDGALVMTGSEIAYGIKDQSGFAVQYYNYYDLKDNFSATNYIWVDADAIASYRDPSCTKPINTFTSNLVQWKLNESLDVFSRTYDVPRGDIRVYDCLSDFITLGTFHKESSGPGGRFSMHIAATPGLSYEAVLREAGTTATVTPSRLDTTTDSIFIVWQTYRDTAMGFTLNYPPNWHASKKAGNLIFTNDAGVKLLAVSAVPLTIQGRKVTPMQYYVANFGTAVTSTDLYKDKYVTWVTVAQGQEEKQIFFTDDTMYVFDVFNLGGTYGIIYDTIQPMIESFTLNDATKRYVNQPCFFLNGC